MPNKVYQETQGGNSAGEGAHPTLSFGMIVCLLAISTQDMLQKWLHRGFFPSSDKERHNSSEGNGNHKTDLILISVNYDPSVFLSQVHM